MSDIKMNTVSCPQCGSAIPLTQAATEQAEKPVLPAPERPLDELGFAIAELLARDRLLPGLVLLYSAIDTFASLGRPAGKDSVTRDDFIRWVDMYLLPNSGLMCTAVDLYAARCALVHSYTPDSALSRQGAARQIQYDPWGSDSLEQLCRLAGLGATQVCVPVEKLFNAFLNATERFELDLSSDPTRQALVDSRANKFYQAVPGEYFESLSSLLTRLQAQSRQAASIEEFISKSALEDTLVVSARHDDGELFYVLVATGKQSADTMTLVMDVRDEVLHGAEMFEMIKSRLAEAGHKFRHVDVASRGASPRHGG